MNLLQKNAKQILESLENEIKDHPEYFENYEDIQEFITESVDSCCIYYNDCHKMAKQADIRQLDLGLWEGREGYNEIGQGIAYAALEQEIFEGIENYPSIEKIYNQ